MCSEWGGMKLWKCPTDRELALRAKINVGWSVHTANAFLKTKAFTLDELHVIEKVIERAQDLEKQEVERIGRMLCKLENMTMNALGDGKKTCSMCGSGSGMFKNSFVNCVDCSKAVCEKCRVDTLTATQNICLLCKICSENREVWKKSGGWFYGKLPTMTEECHEKCVSQTSGSPNPSRAFDTWSHRAPDIVRLQSYEPPEENHNDHSQYTSWTITPKSDETEINSLEKSHVSKEEGKYIASLYSDCIDSSIPGIIYGESLEELEKINTDSWHRDLKINSIPDLTLKDRKTPPFIELESFRKCSVKKKQQDFNYLSTQNAKLSTSCPSLSDIEEPSKLRRKPSIRRKRTSAPEPEKQRNK